MRTRSIARTIAATAVILLVAGACNPHLTRPEGPAPLRYRDSIFTAVTKTTDIVYGSASTQTGSTMSLKLDLYQPTGDTVTKRPAIVWIHGGGFSGGDKSSGEIVDQANVFAKKGYVNVSIDYRLSAGCVPVSSQCIQGITDAKHDAQAAVRYLRAKATTLKIDPNRIAIAGTSAGAITALNVAYGSDDVGTSGNPGPSSKVSAAVSLSGQPILTSPSAGEPAVLYFHGDADPIVSYDGAVSALRAAKKVGLEAYITTFPGAGHVPYSANRTTIIDQTTNFLYDELDAAHAGR